MEAILEIFANYNWDSPFTFVMLLGMGVVYFRKWDIVFVSLVTILVAWFVRNLIVMNIRTLEQVVALPSVIIAVGATVVITIVAISFTRYMLE